MIPTLIKKIWVSRATQNTKQTVTHEIRYQDIPRHTPLLNNQNNSLQCTGNFLSIQTTEFMCQYHAKELHELFNQLALNKDEIDRLLLPVIVRFMEMVNVLPASQYHHHCGYGGLLTHSLQCAIAAVSVAELKMFEQDNSLNQRYQNRPRWLLAASLVGLTHDVGKVFDMDVQTQEGQRWNPLIESLSQWAKRTETQHLFAHWRQERVHKQHELRSLRLLYRYLLTDVQLRYLSDVSGDLIPGAMDEAIIYGTGPLGDILKKAEAISIETDSENRKYHPSPLNPSLSPVSTAILSAIRHLLESGQWKINSDDAQVYVTEIGVFILLKNLIAKQIYQEAVKLLSPYVPSSVDGLIRVLKEEKIIDNFPNEPSLTSVIWPITIKDKNSPVLQCIKLCEAIIPIVGVSQHSTIEVEIEKTQPRNVVAQNDATETSTRLSPLPQQELPQAQLRQMLNPVSLAECEALSEGLMSPEEAKTFVERLLATLKEQMIAGQGFLLNDFCRIDIGHCRCRSQPIEVILEKRKISQKTLEMLLRLYAKSFKLDFDPKGHYFILNTDGKNETPKSSLEMSVRA